MRLQRHISISRRSYGNMIMGQNLTQPEEIDEILRAMAFAVLPFTTPIAQKCPNNAIGSAIDDKRATVSA